METFKMRKVYITNIVLFLVVGASLGFIDSNLNLKIRFEQIYGLQNGNRVIFEQNHIGEVENVKYGRDGIYNVAVAIKNNFAHAATKFSKFLIIDDPRNKDNKAIEIILLQTNGSMLKHGATVEGSSSRKMILEKLALDIEKGLEYLNREIENFQSEIEKLSKSKEYQELKKELAELAEGLKQASKETREKIREELIPKFFQILF